MENVLKNYQARLSAISRRHRAFFLSKIVKKRTFDVATLEHLDKGLSQKVYAAITQQKKSILITKTNLTSKSKQSIVQDLLHLVRDLDSQEKESGYSECYLGDMFIETNLDDGTYVRAPLLLYPVSFFFSRTEQTITLNPLGDVQLNKTLLLGISKYDSAFHTISLSQIRELEKDPISLADQIRPFLEKRGFEFPKESTKSHFIQFDEVAPLTKESAPKKLKHTIKLLPYCVIGQFLQLNSSINFDYQTLVEQKKSNEIFDILTGITPYETNPITDVDFAESDLYTFSIPDSSQERVIKQISESKGLVIHGPPGTGKSQVLSNILVDQLARSKQILVVCEKRAAIDVLYQKLAGIGLSGLCVLVHDAQAKEKNLGAALVQLLESREKLAELLVKKMQASSHVAVESKLADVNSSFDGLLGNQSSLSKVFMDTSAHGISLYELYTRLLEFDNTHVPILALSTKFCEQTNLAKLESYIDLFIPFAETAKRIRQTSYPFFNRVSFSDVDELDVSRQISTFCTKVKSLMTYLKSSDYQDDFDLISLNRSISQKQLTTLGLKLSRFNSYKDSFVRFIHPGVLFTQLRYRRLIREEKLIDLVDRWALFSKECSELFTFLKEITHIFTVDFQGQVRDLLVSSFDGSKKVHPLEVFANELQKASADISLLQSFDSFLEKLDEDERVLFETCYTSLYSQTGDVKQNWSDALRMSFYKNWISSIETKYTQVQSTSAGEFEQTQQRLIELLKEKVSLVPKMIADNHSQKLSSKMNTKAYAQLMHDLSKKKNRYSLREIVAKHENILLDVFPIWMCSPEQVSNIFSLKPNMFDIVLFDEASQLRIEQTIPSIIRAKTVVVSGDEKQLPPTNFFQAGVDEELDEEEQYTQDEKDLLEDESLLVRAKTVFPTQRLAYHYRSTDPSLIDFSNYAFYHGDLKVIPRNESVSKTNLHYEQVNGIWHNNVNEVEAKAVVKRVIQILGKKTKETLGVITFNVKQRDLIVELLEQEAKMNSQFAKLYDAALNRYDDGEFVGLFVKNIENVQGDERDTILFSIGYGFTKQKTFRYNFGPLNGIYGPNRLNVAISRARNEATVFCSFHPRDFAYKGSYDGPKLLGQYLSYVKAVSDKNIESAQLILNGLATATDPVKKAEDLFIRDVYETLKVRGLAVEYAVGATGYTFDVGVLAKDKKSYLCVIECDGSLADQIPGIKERDVFRPQLLSHFGWNIVRVFARDWVKQKDVQVKRILKACGE